MCEKNETHFAALDILNDPLNTTYPTTRGS